MKYRFSDHIETPHGNTTIWRYMNHSKLERLLMDSSLFFANATKMTDKYEITIPDSVIVSKKKEFKNIGLFGDELTNKLNEYAWENDPMKELIMLNCWAIRKEESYALWKIYLGGDKEGIAIKSTLGKLKKSIEYGNDPFSEDFYIGKVMYRKYIKKDERSRMSTIITKKPYYDFESELRVFIMNEAVLNYDVPYNMQKGRNVKINIPTLMHQIYISPFSQDKYKNKVEKLLNRFSYSNIHLMGSKIQDE